MERKNRMSFLFVIISFLTFSLSACSEVSNDKEKYDTSNSSKILVAYFSCTNHTENVAQKIADITGGTLYEIIPAEPYTDADLNYNDNSSRSSEEQNDDLARPAISDMNINMANYEVVYLGYPIWWGKAPKIIYTFLESYDFSNKVIAPFCTSGGSGISQSVENLKRLNSGATWLSGNRFSSSVSQVEVENWISELKDEVY